MPNYNYLIKKIELENCKSYISVSIFDFHTKCIYRCDIKLNDIKLTNKVDSLEKYYELLEYCVRNEKNIEINLSKKDYESLELEIFNDKFNLRCYEYNDVDALRHQVLSMERKMENMMEEINMLKEQIRTNGEKNV